MSDVSDKLDLLLLENAGTSGDNPPSTTNLKSLAAANAAAAVTAMISGAGSKRIGFYSLTGMADGTVSVIYSLMAV